MGRYRANLERSDRSTDPESLRLASQDNLNECLISSKSYGYVNSSEELDEMIDAVPLLFSRDHSCRSYLVASSLSARLLVFQKQTSS